MIRMYKIGGMMCAACSASVERVTRRLPFVDKAQVNLITGRMTVRFDADAVPVPEADERIAAAVTKAGFTCSADIPDKKTEKRKSEETRQKQRRRLTGCVLFAVPLFYIAMGPMLSLPVPLLGTNDVAYALLQAALLLPILFFASNILSSGYKALFCLHPNMHSLVSLGVTASVVYSAVSFFALVNGDPSAVHRLYLDSAGMILTLISLGKYTESRCMAETGKAIEELSSLAPAQALLLLSDGSCRAVPAEELLPGDSVLVKPHERIPADGKLLSEEGSADESMLTGESLPVEKHAGDPVIGGSLNGPAEMRVLVEKTGGDTLLSHMVRLVEEAQGEKAPIARFADRVSAWFVPAVLLVAVLAGGITCAVKDFSSAFHAAVSVLVIACPCALGLATPTAIMVGTGEAAKEGILFSSGAALEKCRGIDTVVLDKTGTLTAAKPAVTGVFPASGIAEEEFIRLFASGESLSEHLLAAAVVHEAEKRGLSLLPAKNGKSRAGFGAEADVDGRHLLMGNARMLREAGIEAPETAGAPEGATLLYLADENGCLGCISVEDPVTAEAAEAVEKLRKRALSCRLLTGDRESSAQAAARSADIAEYVSGALPEDKLAYIKKLQAEGHTVAMVGDGVNDGAALVQADTGFAIGTGTEVAAASADVILVGGKLGMIDRALTVSEKTMKVIRQNLFWALFYNTVGIPLAAFGLLSPMLGALCMSFSSVTVLSNALRLKKILKNT